MSAAYVENDSFAAEWLRQLIAGDHIADGEVFETSIEDIRPCDLARFAQVHLCAGIAVWSYALRCAGWTDDRPVWTASFPCQPFSAAGKGAGLDDERHIWPAGFWLIEQCRPGTLLGEQVSSKDGLAWFDVVSADLEGTGYAVGALDLCAAGFGAPHIRQRNYWCAIDAGRLVDTQGEQARLPGRPWLSGRSDDFGLVADAVSAGRSERRTGTGFGSLASGGGAGRVADDDDERFDGRGIGAGIAGRRIAENDSELGHHHHHQGLEIGSFEAVEPGTLRIEGPALGETGLVRGRWAGADWIFCRDGKWRPVEAGTFPLASGIANRVGSLRGYGNALCAPVAQGFIEAVMDALA